MRQRKTDPEIITDESLAAMRSLIAEDRYREGMANEGASIIPSPECEKRHLTPSNRSALLGLIDTLTKNVYRVYRVGNLSDPMDYSFPVNVQFRDIIEENYLTLEQLPELYDLTVGESLVDTETSVSFQITRIE